MQAAEEKCDVGETNATERRECSTVADGRNRIAPLRRRFVLPFSRGVVDVQLGHRRSRRHCPREARQNAGAKLRGRDWPAEENPLDLMTVGRIEKRRLAGGLDAFDRYAHVQPASERDDRLDHRSDLATGGILRAPSRAFAALMFSSEANNDLAPLIGLNEPLAGADGASLPGGTTTE